MLGGAKGRQRMTVVKTGYPSRWRWVETSGPAWRVPKYGPFPNTMAARIHRGTEK